MLQSNIIFFILKSYFLQTVLISILPNEFLQSVSHFLPGNKYTHHTYYRSYLRETMESWVLAKEECSLIFNVLTYKRQCFTLLIQRVAVLICELLKGYHIRK